METKFDPKAKVKQGQLSDAPDGKQPNREHTNIDFSQHAPRNIKNRLSMTQMFQANLVQNMCKIHCLIWLMKKIINESWTQE